MAEEQQVTTLDLDAIEARANAASYGPWGIELRKEDDPTDFPFYVMGEDWEVSVAAIFIRGTEHPQDLADAEFIAHARDDIPALVQRVRELQDALTPFAEAYENNPVHSDPEFKEAAHVLRGES
jgi:hypothetical protein